MLLFQKKNDQQRDYETINSGCLCKSTSEYQIDLDLWLCLRLSCNGITAFEVARPIPIPAPIPVKTAIPAPIAINCVIIILISVLRSYFMGVGFTGSTP